MAAPHADIEDCGHPTFCIPADGAQVPGCRWDAARCCCPVPECPAQFTPPELRARQRGWAAASPPQLIIAAGPERSGSTWLHNAVRLLFEHARQPLDAFFIGVSPPWQWHGHVGAPTAVAGRLCRRLAGRQFAGAAPLGQPLWASLYKT
ncbi:hypothetical protein ABPG75_008718 [Micractinium tetrahymenae]